MTMGICMTVIASFMGEIFITLLEWSGGQVAFVTLNLFVFSLQQISCLFMHSLPVSIRNAKPADAFVTFSAVVSQIGFVLLFMTGDTAFTLCRRGEKSSIMTFTAIDSTMSSHQTHAWVSTRTHLCTPVGLMMTLCTIGPVTALVRIVFMAARTAVELHVQVLRLRRLAMAFLTTYGLVLLDQFITSQIVIKILEVNLFPVILRMTGETLAAQSIPVRILVTGITFSTQSEIGFGTP